MTTALIEVEVKALGGVRQALGWGERRIKSNSTKVVDLLKELQTQSKQSVFDLVVCDGKVKDGYAVRLNKEDISNLQGLETPLRGNDTVVVMEVLSVPFGG